MKTSVLPESVILSEEKVARIISNEWVVRGVLQPVAFTLNIGESYLSVNRPTISTYNNDVAAFVAAAQDRTSIE